MIRAKLKPSTQARSVNFLKIKKKKKQKKIALMTINDTTRVENFLAWRI
jgi:hypothetical protein